jgi:hypothetical protein
MFRHTAGSFQDSDLPSSHSATSRISNRNLETITWGLLFILWGVTILFDFLPVGIGILGTGVIFLGLNAARSLDGIPTKSATTILGILAIVWGGLELARQFLHLPFDIPVFAGLLIVLGVILLIRVLLRVRQSEQSS